MIEMYQALFDFNFLCFNILAVTVAVVKSGTSAIWLFEGKSILFFRTVLFE